MTPDPINQPVARAKAESNEGKERFTPGRFILNLLSGGIAAVTMAPVGILYISGASKVMAQPATIIFWAAFIATAGYASLTPKRDIGIGLTFVIFLVAMLNVGGCSSAMQAFGK